ncbi:chemotaxis protein CheW [Rhodovarius sp.]|uniref:chemotaxis protein CheW n=1 Tax=Rhodovarius sp. TaxID=2972673 RepID=UPI0033410F05
MAERLEQPPLLRRMPGGWVGFVDGAAWPVHDADGVAEWPGTLWHFDGAALIAEAAPGAVPPPAGPNPPPPAAAGGPLTPRATATATTTALGAMPGMRLLRGAAADVLVPRAALERVLPWPEVQPLAFAPPGVLGLAMAGAAVLVLEGPQPQSLLAVLRLEGRLIGLGCAELRPDPAAGGTEWLPEGAWVLAPLAPSIAPRLEPPSLPLLFCTAGGIRFALPALEVEAVLPPVLPVPGPDHAHIVAHRGQVLPVFDAGLALGGPAVLGQDAVPMLRLGGVAVAVAMVEGLRRVPLSAISAANAASAMRAVCWPAGVAVPVLDPAWLARGA